VYLNRKMRPVETIPGMVGVAGSKWDGGNELNYDLFDIL
jgi:hypothetical protein